ncbi:MAG: alkaline phosphatase, partial [Kiritimatiellae bacterium]|nr:alkaline phosphatase [Kiritimatiellia bacterium]
MQTTRKMFLLAAGAVLAAGLHAVAPRYVFMFIGDGMGMPQRMVAEDYSRRSGRGPLAMNALPYQCLTRTASANALITDSAAAA